MRKVPIDEELWNAVRNDEIAAFNKLFDLYWSKLYKTAYRYLKDQESSEEAVHDVFLSLWNRRHHLVIRSMPVFLLAAVRYQIYNRLRVVKPPVVCVEEYALMDNRLNSNEGQTRLEELELEAEMLSHLHALPKRCKEIFQLSRMEHFTNDEIAEQLDISKRTVENQITLALKHLRLNFKRINIVIFILSLLTVK